MADVAARVAARVARRTFCFVFACAVAVAQTGPDAPQLTPRELFYTPTPRPPESEHASALSVPAHGARASSDSFAVRYGVLQRRPDGQFRGIDVYNTEFHSGDQVRIRLEINRDCYVSILQRGSSGSWSSLYPSAAIHDGQNKVEAYHTFAIPPEPGPGFELDDHPGQEDVVLMVSRHYVDVGPLIERLNHIEVAEGAGARLSDGFLHEFSEGPASIGSRDLVFERAEEETPDGYKETAFYAEHPATPVSDPFASLIHFSLKHSAGPLSAR
jgi:hypothetical protein